MCVGVSMQFGVYYQICSGIAAEFIRIETCERDALFRREGYIGTILGASGLLGKEIIILNTKVQQTQTYVNRKREQHYFHNGKNISCR